MNANENRYSVEGMCRALKVSRSGYYRWRNRPASRRSQENAALLKRIREIHVVHRQICGSPRITLALHEEKRLCSENRVARLMRSSGIRAKKKRKFTRVVTRTEARYPAAENRVNRLFIARQPNRLWVTDMTFIRTREGWLHLAAVLDVCSRKIVGWSVGSQPTADLAQQALERALQQRLVRPGLVHHSDQGAQYANHQYQQFLRSNGIVSSMSRKGNCYDNAMIESFFHTLKMEHVYWHSYRSRREAESSLFDFIELFYNPQRLHTSLGKSPADYEQKFT